MPVSRKVIRAAYDQLALALSFLSRLPMLYGSRYSQANFAASNRWFPLAGMLLGCLQVLVLWLALQLWSPAIASLLALAFGLWLTGCFHEDGLADTADGLFGYVDRDTAFRIMKDSRLGTYGASALMLSLLLKWLLWQQVAVMSLAAIVGAQVVSRWAPVLVMQRLAYSEPNAANRKPSATGRSLTGLVIASVVALAWLLSFSHAWLVALTLTVVMALVWQQMLQRRLGGWTGDTLGALQVLNELALLLLFVAWFSP